MNKLLILAFLLCSMVVSATTWYISPSGNDSTPGNGSISNPYRSLSKAASVSTSGDIISVSAGNYASTLICNLPVGVSISGAGKTLSKFTWTNTGYDLNSMIVLSSVTINTPGNQSISGISIDGVNSTGKMGIYVYYRGNVTIHDCNFINLDYSPVRFYGLQGVEYYQEPSTYVTGNSFYDCTVTNCDKQNINGIPSGLMASSQDGFLIYGCNMQGLSDLAAGDIINIAWSKNVKIHDNIVRRGSYMGTGEVYWWFSMEIRWNYGGFEIYNNDVRGTIDLCFNYVANSTKGYSVKVHHNTIGQDAVDNLYTPSIDFEGDTYDAYVYDNVFRNCAYGVITSVTTPLYNHLRGLHIYRNLMYGISKAAGPGGSGIMISGTEVLNNVPPGYVLPPGYTLPTFRDIYIDNNTIIASATGYAYQKGIYLPNIGDTHNLRVRNNIIVGFTYAGIFANLHTSSPGASYDSLYIQYNDLYTNGYNNDYFRNEGITVTNDLSGGNLKLNPSFVSTTDFSLQSNSQMIDIGMDVGLYFYTFPDLGAAEYVPAPTHSYTPGIVKYPGKVVKSANVIKH